jgi:hypothetical protein
MEGREEERERRLGDARGGALELIRERDETLAFGELSSERVQGRRVHDEGRNRPVPPRSSVLTRRIAATVSRS